VDILWDIVPLLLLGLTWLGFMLYPLIVERDSFAGDRAVLLDIIMHLTMVMFAALLVYFVWG
jgi:hypothetical protein